MRQGWELGSSHREPQCCGDSDTHCHGDRAPWHTRAGHGACRCHTDGEQDPSEDSVGTETGNTGTCRMESECPKGTGAGTGHPSTGKQGTHEDKNWGLQHIQEGNW